MFWKTGDNYLLFTFDHYFPQIYTLQLFAIYYFLFEYGRPVFLQISTSDKEQLVKIYGREDLFEISPKGTSPCTAQTHLCRL